MQEPAGHLQPLATGHRGVEQFGGVMGTAAAGHQQQQQQQLPHAHQQEEEGRLAEGYRGACMWRRLVTPREGL